jgi:hypothetical protein
MRFSLRTMLILVAAIAVLMAQYPYVRMYETVPATLIYPDSMQSLELSFRHQPTVIQAQYGYNFFPCGRGSRVRNRHRLANLLVASPAQKRLSFKLTHSPKFPVLVLGYARPLK